MNMANSSKQLYKVVSRNGSVVFFRVKSLRMARRMAGMYGLLPAQIIATGA
jgi:hypothetical protein